MRSDLKTARKPAGAGIDAARPASSMEVRQSAEKGRRLFAPSADQIGGRFDDRRKGLDRRGKIAA